MLCHGRVFRCKPTAQRSHKAQCLLPLLLLSNLLYPCLAAALPPQLVAQPQADLLIEQVTVLSPELTSAKPAQQVLVRADRVLSVCWPILVRLPAVFAPVLPGRDWMGRINFNAGFDGQSCPSESYAWAAAQRMTMLRH